MNYISTRDENVNVTASTAIVKGISADGGLFVPKTFTKCNYEDLYTLSYPQVAAKILSLFLNDYSQEFLEEATKTVYSDENFSSKAGNLTHVSGNKYSLELWHGPTCAFKDYALQIMPKLFVEAKKITKDDRITKILVATSGDTGKAALAGYENLDKIRIAVFYPNNGTSEIQRLQMVTHNANNVQVYAVNGNFDDAQTGVKRVFANKDIEKTLQQENSHLSSANSINLGRLLPQIVYYFYAYAQLVKAQKIKSGQKINFCVPTGNFGDILAGYYAKQMGLPINKLVCASNKNNVLTEFFKTGTYNAKRNFHKTLSPSMDILISSNLERLLYHITKDASEVKKYMDELNEKGSYTVCEKVLREIQSIFEAECADDEKTKQTIAHYAKNENYVMDTHTAVAFYVADNLKSCNEDIITVVLSTASPYKFPHDVLNALGQAVETDINKTLVQLNNISKLAVPKSLVQLTSSPVLFNNTINAQDIEDIALKL